MAFTPQRLIVRASGLVNTQLYTTHWPLFFTVTYENPHDWRPEQITRFINNYRTYLYRKGFKQLVYVWTCENNPNRPGVHYHGVLWIPNGVLPPKPDQQGWWKHGHTNVQRARNPAAYLAKYISKSAAPLDLPPKSRRYSINVRSILNLDFLRCPNWMCYFSKFGDRIKYVKGYGWVNFTTNKAYKSPYRWVKGIGAHLVGWDDHVPDEKPDWVGKVNYRWKGLELTYFDLWNIALGIKPKLKECWEV